MLKVNIARFLPQLKKKNKKVETRGKGLILFSETSEAIRAESILKKAGFDIKMVAPPYHLRKGCDLSIEFNIMEQLAVERILKKLGNPPLDIVPITEKMLEPVNILRETDYGKWIMIRTANMKLTFDKETKIIVNISGGGCPDVPYLANEMIGKKLEEAPSPRELGYTVCAYALNVSFENAKKWIER
ncbi:MAG: hypothetical protein DRP55_06240 [Spirochaetes bacterium]|nr:MAG: hypothetical protein DRP55_06240 [Spirochaetota bacterium]